MNQIDTGKFIASCRKEKGLTQAQLAEKLNITDRVFPNGRQEFPIVKDTTPNITTPRLYGT